MRGAPHTEFARLSSPMSARSSAETFGRPTRLRDRERQYARKPARRQRTIVSDRTSATAPSTGNGKRSLLLRSGRFGIRRRRTLICRRRIRTSASRFALDLKSEASNPRISLGRSVIRPQGYAVRSLRPAESSFPTHPGSPAANGGGKAPAKPVWFPAPTPHPSPPHKRERGWPRTHHPAPPPPARPASPP